MITGNMNIGYRNLFGDEKIQTPLFYETSGVDIIVTLEVFGRDMAYAWFICPYKRRDRIIGSVHKVGRYCAMDDFTTQIRSDGGDWSESEVLGNHALVKVRANDVTIAAIAATTGFIRLSAKWTLSDTLGDLTAVQHTTVNNKLLSLGYTQAEIDTAMGATLAQWRTKTFEQLLDLVATRRLKPRYIEATDTIVCDGAVQPVRSIYEVDNEVK
jgi:hypothetical protein